MYGTNQLLLCSPPVRVSPTASGSGPAPLCCCSSGKVSGVEPSPAAVLLPPLFPRSAAAAAAAAASEAAPVRAAGVPVPLAEEA